LSKGLSGKQVAENVVLPLSEIEKLTSKSPGLLRVEPLLARRLGQKGKAFCPEILGITYQ
jgi:hypothetical protein